MNFTQLKELYDMGWPFRRIGLVLGISGQRVHQIAKERGWQRVKQKPLKQAKKAVKDDMYYRNLEILNLLREGETYQSVADKFNISKQRVDQILTENGWKNKCVLGYKKVINEKKQEIIDQKNRQLIEKYGTTEVTKRIKMLYKKFRQKRYTAHNRNYPFEIEFKDIEWPEYCPIFKIKLDYMTSKLKPDTPTFDRIDNTKGYVKGNVHIICWEANMLKRNYTQEKIRELSRQIVKENGNKLLAKKHQLIADYLSDYSVFKKF